MAQGAIQSGGQGGAILPWRFVVGALLHLIVPAWLASIAIGWFAAPPVQGARATLLGTLAARSLAFLAAYAALILAAGLLAAALDPWLRARRVRRAKTDPAAAARDSAAGLEAALAHAAAVLADNRVAADALAALGAARLDHADPGTRQLAVHVTEAAHSFTRALAAAAPDRRATIVADAARTFERLASAAAALAAGQARVAENEAACLARFVELRYDPAPDFPRSHSG